MLSISIHEHNRESHHLPNLLVLYANCPDSQPRNKAKNALSLAMPFSFGLAGAKIDKIWIGQEEKRVFFIKMVAGWENVCNFAAREPAKPLNDA